MPRYFFDVHDGDRPTKDEEGQELPDLPSVRKTVLSLLPDIAREVMPDDGDRHDVILDVHDATGMVIYTATLSLIGRWLE